MKNTTIKFEVAGIGTINVSATMKGESKNYSHDVKKLNEEALRGALDCILGDISMYLNDEIRGCYDEYEEASLLKRVENGCRREYEKFMVVVGGDENVWTAIQSLSEQINAND